GASKSATVTPAATSKLTLTGLPPAVTAGQASTVHVTAADQFGNQTGFTGPVSFSSTDPQASLPSGAALTAGAGDFSVTLRTAGTQTVTVSDPANVMTPATATTKVNPAAASKFFQLGVPPQVTAGTPFLFTVLIQDQFGNAAVGTAHFSVDDPQGTVPADYVFTAADNGSKTFSATLR